MEGLLRRCSRCQSGQVVKALAVVFVVNLASATQAMELGSNFWNLGWHKPGDCFRDVKNVTGDNPWNPQFLEEIAIYRSFRFMDWDNTNNSQRESWSQRTARGAAKQNPAAYEWMIDLCNRMDADMWVTVPHRTINHTMGDEPGVLQRREVARDGRLAHREGTREVSGAGLTGPEPVEDGAAGGIGEGAEEIVECGIHNACII